MKNFLLLLSLAMVLVSCKKSTDTYVGKDPHSLDSAIVISTGKISFTDDRYDEGVAKIYLRKDGVYVLALEQMNYQVAYGEINVYLSSTLQLATTSIKIFSAKKLHASLYYPLSSAINIPAFKYVIIQVDTDTNPVADATLN